MMTLQFQENNVTTAHLRLHTESIHKISQLTPNIVNLVGFLEPSRLEVERFIQRIFKINYGAEIKVDYPVLMSVRNQNNEILAALGFRFAKSSTLFLERHTTHKIENYLDCPREHIVEIGNLASAGQGASTFLFIALASYLHHQNILYAAVTGTDFLHHYFKKIDLKPRKICNANMNGTNGDGQNWGTYYDSSPCVLVGSISHGFKRLNTLFGAEYELFSSPLKTRLHPKWSGDN